MLRHTAAIAVYSACAVIGAGALSQCDSISQSAAAVTRTDSAGVRIVVTHQGNDSLLAEFVIADAPTIRIGSESNDSKYQIASLAGARQLASGSLAIADAQRYAIRIYDHAGTFVRDVGRRGEGPGEFRDISYFSTRGDTLIVCCGPGVVEMTSGGVVVRGSAAVIEPVVGVLRDGGHIQIHRDRVYGLDATRREVRVMALSDSLYYEGPDAGTGIKVGVFWARDQINLFDPETNPLGYNQMYIESPFMAEARFAVWDDGFYYAPGTELRVDSYDRTGRLKTSYRLLKAVQRVTPAMLRQFEEESVAAYKKADQKAFMRWILGQLPRPVALPPLLDMLAADDGSVWLRESSYPVAPLQTWHMFKPDGAYAGIVQAPVAWQLLQVGSDFVLVSLTNALGEPVVERHQLVHR
jgi:hypothetical protein